MAKQNVSEQLDRFVSLVLASPESALSPGDSNVTSLLQIARGLRYLPREDFKMNLKSELKRRASMAAQAVNPAREGFRSITLYLIVSEAAREIEFMKQAFDATEVLRVPKPGTNLLMHAEVRIDDSMVEMADANPEYPPRPAAILLTVNDTDAYYKRAIAAGATSLAEPVDQPYGDREAAVKDMAGNRWYITKRRVADHMPADIPAVTPNLEVVGAAKFIEFLKGAFGGEEAFRFDDPNGNVAHAKVRIGNSYLSIGEAHGQFQPMPCALHLYVNDTDATYEKALRAGATTVRAPENTNYGDRSAGVKDAFGNQWWIATHIGNTKA